VSNDFIPPSSSEEDEDDEDESDSESELLDCEDITGYIKKEAKTGYKMVIETTVIEIIVREITEDTPGTVVPCAKPEGRCLDWGGLICNTLSLCTTEGGAEHPFKIVVKLSYHIISITRTWEEEQLEHVYNQRWANHSNQQGSSRCKIGIGEVLLNHTIYIEPKYFDDSSQISIILYHQLNIFNY